jgi:hypothetical protein
MTAAVLSFAVEASSSSWVARLLRYCRSDIRPPFRLQNDWRTSFHPAFCVRFGGKRGFGWAYASEHSRIVLSGDANRDRQSDQADDDHANRPQCGDAELRDHKDRWRTRAVIKRRFSRLKGRGELQRLVVNPVAVVDSRARKLGHGQHSTIVLEDPAELADIHAEFPDAVAARVLDHHEGEHARHA